MVCIGNICRSPLAEGILKDKLAKSGLDFIIDSAGIISYHAGEEPDYRSIETARRHGIDISGQIARKFSPDDFEKFDLIFAMDNEVSDELISLAKSSGHRKKIHLFLEYAGYKSGSIVPDPYYGTKNDFENVFLLIDDACDKMVNKFLKKNLF